MMMTLRGSAGSGVPPRRALEWARAPSPYPARPAEGGLRLPKNFLKKRKDAEEGIFCGAVSRQAVPPFLPIVQRSAPTDTGAARPPGFFVRKTQPLDVLFTASRPWCCGSS